MSIGHEHDRTDINKNTDKYFIASITRFVACTICKVGCIAVKCNELQANVPHE